MQAPLHPLDVRCIRGDVDRARARTRRDAELCGGARGLAWVAFGTSRTAAQRHDGLDGLDDERRMRGRERTERGDAAGWWLTHGRQSRKAFVGEPHEHRRSATSADAVVTRCVLLDEP